MYVCMYATQEPVQQAPTDKTVAQTFQPGNNLPHTKIGIWNWFPGIRVTSTTLLLIHWLSYMHPPYCQTGFCFTSKQGRRDLLNSHLPKRLTLWFTKLHSSLIHYYWVGLVYTHVSLNNPACNKDTVYLIYITIAPILMYSNRYKVYTPSTERGPPQGNSRYSSVMIANNNTGAYP